MAGSRDQAARIIRTEAELAEPTPLRDAPSKPVAAEAPLDIPAADNATTSKPAPPPKSGKRRVVLVGVGLLLAIAAAVYGVNYYLVGRFLVSTDDA
ncbi:MAG: hemolysin, partial [Tardiphaga sp.]|nr:hemolysin [Tardiphaga sp.]